MVILPEEIRLCTKSRSGCEAGGSIKPAGAALDAVTFQGFQPAKQAAA